MRIAGALAASAGSVHGRYASFKNQAKKAGVKNPGKSAVRLTAASHLGDFAGPLGGIAATHLAGFGKSAPVSTRATELSKLAG
jgi:hypothetical protein